MKNSLEFVLFSRHSLIEPMARRQIATLVNFDGGIVCPDKWGTFEPLKTPFDAGDISVPVKKLAEPQGDFFYRKGKPIQVEGEIWNLALPPTARFPSPLFSNYWTGRFERKWVDRVGLLRVQACVHQMFRASGADFGFLTTEVDKKAKNTTAQVLSYMGMNLDEGVPGLYWLNLFSHGFARRLGVDTFPSELAETTCSDESSISIMFAASPELCRDIEVLQKQRAAIEWLGSERFFDIRSPDRKLHSPNWERIPLPNVSSPA